MSIIDDLKAQRLAEFRKAELDRKLSMELDFRNFDADMEQRIAVPRNEKECQKTWDKCKDAKEVFESEIEHYKDNDDATRIVSKYKAQLAAVKRTMDKLISMAKENGWKLKRSEYDFDTEERAMKTEEDYQKAYSKAWHQFETSQAKLDKLRDRIRDLDELKKKYDNLAEIVDKYNEEMHEIEGAAKKNGFKVYYK